MLAVGFCLLIGTLAKAELRLPADPSLWINTPPVSFESLKGKGVVLYFFEEQCPKCEGEWPKVLATAQKFADKPVVFLGISSGTNRDDIEDYVRRNGIRWPVVLDPTREFEKAAGVGEISLMNIMQVKYVSADGALHGGNWSDLGGTAERALAGAAWRVDPAGIPANMKPAWMQIELGNFAAASAMVKKATSDKKPEVKAIGDKLEVAVKEAMTRDIAAAEKSAPSAGKWETYKAFKGIADRYKGYALPEDFKAAGTALHNDEEVIAQRDAMIDLENVSRQLASKSPAVRKKAFEKLDKIISDHAGTEAAKMAQDFKAQAALK
jgi:thiol-disulfide isomerase/thioredoxin